MDEKPKVLLVDRDRGSRRTAVRTLRRLGCSVHAVTSATDALRRAGRVRGLDLLVTSVLLPDMSGLELAARLQRSQLTQLRVLYVSDCAGVVKVNRPWQPGSECLTTPFRVADLIRKTREVLGAEDGRERNVREPLAHLQREQR